MKKTLQYLIVLIAVLAAHLGVAAALMKAANAPASVASVDTPESVAPAVAPVTKPDQKTKTPPPSAKRETRPEAPGGNLPAAPVSGGVTPAGPPLPNEVPPSPKQETPVASPISTGPIGLPLPSDDPGREQSGKEIKGFTPEDRDVISKVLEDAVSPRFEEATSAPAAAPPAKAEPPAAETAVGTAAVPEKMDSPPPLTAPEITDSPAPVATPEITNPTAPVATPVADAPSETRPPPEQAGNNTPAPTNEVPSGSPAKKLIRDLDPKDLEANRKKIEERIKKNLPSAVEAFAPDSIGQNDIDAVIREAQTNLRQQMSGLKKQAPGGASSNP